MSFGVKRARAFAQMQQRRAELVGVESTYPDGGATVMDVDGDRRRAVRRLSRNGNSTTITVPPEFLHSMGRLPGELVELVSIAGGRAFVVRPYHTARASTSSSASTSESNSGT